MTLDWKKLQQINSRLAEVSYYELLGLDRSAPVPQILARYYELAARFHPDRHASNAHETQVDMLNRLYARLGEAKRVLCSLEDREHYDRGLARGTLRFVQGGNAKLPKRVPRVVQKGPTHPLARNLYEDARRAHSAGELNSARSKIKLAAQYEPESEAICALMKELDVTPKREQTGVEPEVPQSLQPRQMPVATGRAAPPAPAVVVAAERPARTSEERVHARVTTAIPVRLKLRSWEQFQLFYTRDISVGGMFLRSEKLLGVGARIALTLLTPNGEELVLESEVMHQRHQGCGQAPGMGLRFKGLNSEEKKRLAELLQHSESENEAIHNFSFDELVSYLVEINGKSPREVLRLPEKADRAQIFSAYKTLCQRFHPSNQADQSNPATVEVCREIIAAIRNAFESIGGSR